MREGKQKKWQFREMASRQILNYFLNDRLVGLRLRPDDAVRGGLPVDRPARADLQRGRNLGRGETGLRPPRPEMFPAKTNPRRIRRISGKLGGRRRVSITD